MIHKFRAGESVRFCRGYPYRDAAEGLYEVLQQLPYSDGEHQYRIKSAQETRERVVRESELDSTQSADGTAGANTHPVKSPQQQGG